MQPGKGRAMFRVLRDLKIRGSVLAHDVPAELRCADRSCAGRSEECRAASRARTGDSTAVARQFLQKFHDWYAPFVQTDPRYPVTDVRHGGRSYRATVQPVCPTPAAQSWQTLDKTTVVEVIPEASRWKIANVFYEKFDLKRELCFDARTDRRPDHGRKSASDRERWHRQSQVRNGEGGSGLGP